MNYASVGLAVCMTTTTAVLRFSHNFCSTKTSELRATEPRRCLVEMLETIWLKHVHPPATWAATIVGFLGEEQLGNELMEKYILLYLLM